MKRRNTLFTCFPLFVLLLSGVWVNAQTFTGNATNTAGNALIPSTGTGGCTVAPQNTGGTVFECNVAGLGPNVKLLSVQINLTHTSDADLDIFLEAPGTLTQTTPQRIELAGDLGGTGDNFNNTQFCDNATTAINGTGVVAPFTGTFRPEGTLVVSCDPDGTGPLTAYAGNVTTIGAFNAGQNGVWKLRIFDDLSANSGTMISWSLTFADPTCTFSGVTLPNLTIDATDPSTCGATNASLTAPALTCSSPIAVSIDGTFFANVLPGQSFVVPTLSIGGHTIRYALSACDFVQQSVNVVDRVPPTITCPANMFINLGPGACSAAVNYDVGTADNCPFFGPIVTLPTISQTQNNNFDGITFDIRNDGATPIQITGFRAPIIAGAHTVNVYYTTTATTAVGNQANPAAWTLLGSANVTGNGTAPTTNIPVGGLILQPGQQKGIYMYLTDLTTFYYANGNLLSTDGTLSIISQGHFGGQGPFVNANTPRAFIGAVIYQTVSNAETVQTAGLPSGAEFPIGTTTNCFITTDFAGNTATCCFDITVLEYPNPIQSLVCNDLVQVSLDANCEAVVGADQVLEGGPYGCYDDYIVELDKTLPFGNGPWVPAVLGPGDVGKTYQVRVTDPENNNNKCWGNIKVEDKLPPNLVCRPADTLLCNQNPAPGLFPTGSGVTTFAAVGLPVTTQEAQTATFNIPVNLPSNAVILDVDFRMRVTSNAPPGPFQAPWDYDMGVQLFNPGGNIEVWPFWGYGGCGAVPVFAIWDDDVPANAACAALSTGARSAILPPFIGPITRMDFFDGISPNGNWTVRFGDQVWDNVANDNANSVYTFEIAELIITWVAYGASLPNDLQLNVNAFPTGPNSFNVPSGQGNPILESCSDVTLTYLDTEVAQDCASGLSRIINRKWTATDASGNSATCLQVLRFLRPSISDVVPPPNYDDIDEDALECNSAYPSPDYLEGIGKQGYPYVFGEPDGCSISWTYVDNVIDVCDGTYKILREWKIIDWCTGDIELSNQIIKVLDDSGPAMDCPAETTVGTDPFTCCATADLPDLIIEDNCSRIASISAMIQVIDPQTSQVIAMHTVGGSLQNFPGNNLWDLDTLANFGVTPCLPPGRHLVTYMAEDDCGNTSTCTFRLNVVDLTPPVAACDEFTVVGIGVDDPFDCYEPSDACNFAGVTWVKAKTFDDGSYDNCGDLLFTIKRMAPYSDCINSLSQLNGHPPCNPLFPNFPSEFEKAEGTFQERYDPNWQFGVEGADSIKFYCCEVGTTQTVVLRVYQLDANGLITKFPDGTPVHNQCMIEVSVQDKIKPVCQSPANVSVSCENFDPSLWAYGKASVYDNCCLDTATVYQGQCGLGHSVNLSAFDTVCNKGTITRTFRAIDCQGQSSTCTQRIFVSYEQDYFLRFPNDVIVTVCDGTGNYGEPVFFGEDCELLGVSFEDEVFTVVPDACYKIERTWTIINWCTYDPNKGCVEVPNPNPNAILNHPQNLTGPTISALGTPSPWTPSNVPVAPGQSNTNYSVFYHGGTYNGVTIPNIANNNCFKYKQIIKVIDTQDPQVTCPASPVEICDLTPNDPLLWNAMYWYDATINSHDLCEAPTDLCITATDLCSGANLSIRYLLFLDLDGDGTMESVVNSVNTGIAGLGWNAVPYGNAGNPNYGGGQIRQFDGRPVPANQKWGFAIQQTTSGTNRTACVRFNTQQQQNTYLVPELPYGTHKIKWFIEDGCGNETICEYTFVVKDCKKPTVVCINGLSVNIMPTKMIALWDTDFLQYTEDNCTPSGQLVTAIRRSGTGTGFPLNPDGTPQKSVTFTCDDLGTQLVELWSIDKAGNADYCETYVIVQDNMGICDGNSATVAGTLKTEQLNGLEEAKVDLNGSHPALPPVSMFTMSDNDGDYSLAGVPFLGNYTLTPTKDNDPLNGVSTFDLVLINKHILGLEPLNTPYKMIAADANNSRSITTFDIVELRKLILGIYTELPNNTSWRFVDKSYTFPNPSNPFLQIFPETKQIADLQADMLNEHFTSVKVGDVNGNAVSNSLMSADDRTAGTLLFDVEDRAVKAGETFTVTFKAAEKVQGYQFTMNYPNLEVMDIVPGANMKVDNFAVFAKEGALTTSWDGEAQAEFGITFRAKAAGQLSQMLGVSSRITRAEAYNAESDRLQVAFRFNSPNGSTIAGLGFELYQNTPNPFVNRTQIGFYLPEATSATLTVFDESGRMIYTQGGDFAKGYNAVTIDRSVLNTTGVLYYKLETATDSATRKMIQSK